MGKKNKKKTKIKKEKTIEEKKEFVELVKDKMQNLNLNENNEGIIKFYKILDDYVKFGYNASGCILITSLGRNIHYVLSNKKHIENTTFLKKVL